MLDKRSEALLRIINKECNEGSYRVLEVDDLIRLMPKNLKLISTQFPNLWDILKRGSMFLLNTATMKSFAFRRFQEAEEFLRLSRKKKTATKNRSLKNSSC